MTIPESLTGKALFDFLIKNKSLLIAAKKAVVKEADGIPGLYVNEKGQIVKTIKQAVQDSNTLDATLIINTTNYFDSHGDVHIPGIWKKSIAETKEMYLLNQHVMSFEDIITDTIKTYTKKFSWKDLGYGADGITEALVFDAVMERVRNPFMFGQYEKGYVKNHSVGMRYVKIFLAINDDNYKEEFAIWNTYEGDIVNLSDAESAGYFWAVTEAKVIEGSAVVRGSNKITPVYSIGTSSKESTEDQPPPSTENQPQESLEDATDKAINWDKIAKAII